MTNKARLKQFLVISFISWIVLAAAVFFFTYQTLETLIWVILLGLVGLTAATSLLTLNQSQLQIAESNKDHSRTKRQVQEHQLKIDRYEYDAKKASELRRIVLNSTQEKDHALRNMALALDHAMDEILDISLQKNSDALAQIMTRAESMKRYAADLQALAKLELKSELPVYREIDFLVELEGLISLWNSYGKNRGVKVKVDNPEEQMPVVSDTNWLINLLSRIAYALIRMNEQTTLYVHVIGYLDADLGDALRISFEIDGRTLEEKQLQHVMTEYVSIIEEGQEVGPGLTFVVARRVAQVMNGFIEVQNTSGGMEVLVVVPRNPSFEEQETLLSSSY